MRQILHKATRAFQVPLSRLSISKLEYAPFFCHLIEPRLLSICMVPGGTAPPLDPLGSVALLFSLQTSAYLPPLVAVL